MAVLHVDSYNSAHFWTISQLLRNKSLRSIPRDLANAYNQNTSAVGFRGWTPHARLIRPSGVFTNYRFKNS